MLDLDYAEDSQADTDANFVLTGSGKIVEVQATAEKTPFTGRAIARPCSRSRAKASAKLIDLQKNGGDVRASRDPSRSIADVGRW